jgi:L-ascorbate metabolism protein UlaG (beta-lactamase superfamily)
MHAYSSRRLNGKANTPDTTPPTVTVRKPEFLPTRDTPKLRATWLGHACYYVEFPSGLRVLFDPVFEARCGPRCGPYLLGPKRFTEPPCQIKDIPVIDAVVISHNHYDHLSHPTVSEIAKRHPDCHFFAPLGNKAWFHSSGIQNVTEMDWWDERGIELSPKDGKGPQVEPAGEASVTAEIKARISCLPCQHITARGPFDKYKTLWASWAIESGGSKVYFAGYEPLPQPFYAVRMLHC